MPLVAKCMSGAVATVSGAVRCTQVSGARFERRRIVHATEQLGARAVSRIG